MDKMIMVATCLLVTLVSCNIENDFYEVGKQPVFLNYPVEDTTWVLNKQKPDSLYSFSWGSKRPYMEFNLVFSAQADLSGQRVEVPTGIKRTFYLTTREIDRILSALDFGLGEQCTVYWSVDVINPPDAGWCDERRSLKITRPDTALGE